MVPLLVALNQDTMKRYIVSILVLLMLPVVALMSSSTTSVQESSSCYYEFSNVDINIMPKSDMIITETQNFVCSSGDYQQVE